MLLHVKQNYESSGEEQEDVPPLCGCALQEAMEREEEEKISLDGYQQNKRDNRRLRGREDGRRKGITKEEERREGRRDGKKEGGGRE